MKRFFLLILAMCQLHGCSVTTNGKSEDTNLVVPGSSAEGFIIGNIIDKSRYRIYRREVGSVSEILGVGCFDIQFDEFIYNRGSSVVFINDGKVTAIAGLKAERRVTSDGVRLSRGVEKFVYVYGEEGLERINSGNHSLYIYKRLGIAVFNDDGDGLIDMYMVFNPMN